LGRNLWPSVNHASGHEERVERYVARSIERRRKIVFRPGLPEAKVDIQDIRRAVQLLDGGSHLFELVGGRRVAPEDTQISQRWQQLAKKLDKFPEERTAARIDRHAGHVPAWSRKTVRKASFDREAARRHHDRS